MESIPGGSNNKSSTSIKRKAIKPAHGRRYHEQGPKRNLVTTASKSLFSIMKCLLNSVLLCQAVATSAFVVTSRQQRYSRCEERDVLLKKSTVLFAAGDEEEIESTSFADAGKSIVDAQDEERMKAMGDFDSNSAVSRPSVVLMGPIHIRWLTRLPFYSLKIRMRKR